MYNQPPLSPFEASPVGRVITRLGEGLAKLAGVEYTPRDFSVGVMTRAERLAAEREPEIPGEIDERTMLTRAFERNRY